MIRVVLPPHLRALAGLSTSEVAVEVSGVPTQRTVLDAVEARYPMLLGTMRDRGSGLRRPLLRFYADGEDLSDTPPDEPLPDVVVSGREPYVVIGAIAGG